MRETVPDFVKRGISMASANDIKSATETYGGFITLFKWGAVATAIIVATVVALIA